MEERLKGLVVGKNNSSSWQVVRSLEEALEAASHYPRLHTVVADGRQQLLRMVKQVEVGQQLEQEVRLASSGQPAMESERIAAEGAADGAWPVAWETRLAGLSAAIDKATSVGVSLAKAKRILREL